MRHRPDNHKDGFQGYTHENVLADYEAGEGHLIVHDTLGCSALKGADTITVWKDNLHVEDENGKTIAGVFIHMCRL